MSGASLGVCTPVGLKGLEVGSLPWEGACFLPSRPPSPKSRVPDHSVVLGCPPPTGPLVLWSELLFKRNFRPVSRSGSPSVHRVPAALPGGGRGAAEGRGGRLSSLGVQLLRRHEQARGERLPWQQHRGPREPLLVPACGLVAVEQGVMQAECFLLLVGAFFVTAVLASWPGDTAVCAVSALASSPHLFSFK